MVNETLNSELHMNIGESGAQKSPTARNTEPADVIFQGTARMLADRGWVTLNEVPLANNRRADIMGLSRKGEILIVEVKSCLADFTSDGKWPEYAPYCNAFYFAVNEAFPHQHIPPSAGLIIADGFGGDILREPRINPLAAARRKALTLKFARLAASRLHRVLTPSVA